MTAALSTKAVRLGPTSWRLRPAMLIINSALALALVVLGCIDMCLGDFQISLAQVLDVLGGSGTRAQRYIILESRLPRVLTAALAGAALALSGALTQSLLRNPLASPDLLGITAGASFAAVAAITGAGFTAGYAAALGVPLAALAGGLLTGVAIYLLSWRDGADGMRIVLVGIGVNAMLLSGVSWLLVTASINEVARAQIWLNGSINSATWAGFTPVAAALLIVVLPVLGMTRSVAALRLGPATAQALGTRVQAAQGLLLLGAAAAAALATAAVGPVVFVALAAPQLARRLLRSPGEPLAGSMLVGAVLLVASDIIAATVLPVDLPVGIVTAALGGPFLLFLLIRTARKVTV